MESNEREASHARKSLLEAYCAQAAISLLFHLVTREMHAEITRTAEKFLASSEESAHAHLATIQEMVEHDRQRYQIRATQAELAELWLVTAGAPRGQSLLLPIYTLVEMCEAYLEFVPELKRYPLHARVAMDPGFQRETQGAFEVVLLEAVLFEDMCALVNDAERRTRQLTSESSKVESKAADAAIRASVLASFSFVEAYINGVAREYCAAHVSKLDAKTQAFLLETARYVSIRDKLLQYPRLILGSQHPPLQESNCAPMKAFLSLVKDLRDSIVHAAPMPRLDLRCAAIAAQKESHVLNPAIEDVHLAARTAIDLVRVLELTLRGNLEGLDWLTDPDEDGTFGERTFL